MEAVVTKMKSSTRGFIDIPGSAYFQKDGFSSVWQNSTRTLLFLAAASLPAAKTCKTFFKRQGQATRYAPEAYAADMDR
jgi:hypothetical protein